MRRQLKNVATAVATSAHCYVPSVCLGYYVLANPLPIHTRQVLGEYVECFPMDDLPLDTAIRVFFAHTLEPLCEMAAKDPSALESMLDVFAKSYHNKASGLITPPSFPPKFYTGHHTTRPGAPTRPT